MAKVYIAVSKEEFKRQLVKADANGMREQLLMDAIKVNTLVFNGSTFEKDAVKAKKLGELMCDETSMNSRKLEKTVLSVLFD